MKSDDEWLYFWCDLISKIKNIRTSSWLFALNIVFMSMFLIFLNLILFVDYESSYFIGMLAYGLLSWVAWGMACFYKDNESKKE